MRWALCLLLLPLAGCIEDPGDPVGDPSVIDWYVYEYPGWDTLAGDTHGYAVLLTAHRDLQVQVNPLGGVMGRAYQNGQGHALEPFEIGVMPMQANATMLVTVEAAGASGGFDLTIYAGGDPPYTIAGPRWQLHEVAGTPVEPGQHVQTHTVGLWTNGTSFYTNIQALNDDPAFPAGYDRNEFGGAALPIYVYDRDRIEQPTSSKDTCHFTTITGYNQLLKSQHEQGTNIRYLQPEEAYTVAGAEDHFLYGDGLIFMNTVAAITETTDVLDNLPAPTGACFDVQNTVDYVTSFTPL